MSQGPEPASQSWWKTLPGLLTAAAATITAITGLIVAVHQTGFFDHGPQPSTQVRTQPAGANPSTQTPSSANQTASRPLVLPANTEVHSGQSVYKLLSARLDPYSPGQVSLHFKVRMSNEDRFNANFWSASFRLRVNDNLQPPANDLNELIPAQSTKEADIEFVVPTDTTTVGLQMGAVGEDAPAITIRLQDLKQ
jgi:hypothetical protein